MRPDNPWSAANTRLRMERMKERQKEQIVQKSARETVIIVLCLVFIAMVGLAVFLWPASASQPLAASLKSNSDFSCRVQSITDGDTLRCADGTRVRLHAVAARERDETCSPGHPCPSASAASATAKLSELAQGQTLQCERTGTSYERVTAICRNEANMEINCAMVRSGTTLIWPRFNSERAICN